VGDLDRANKLAVETAELMFPHFAKERQDFYDGSMQTLKSLRGVGFRFSRADGR